MPKYGGSSDYTLAPTELDPLKFTPNYADTAAASIAVPAEQTVAREGVDRLWLEAGLAPIGATDQEKQFLTVPAANQQFGLDLKPTYAKRISVGLAEYFQRKQIQSQIDQTVLQQSPPDPITGFMGSVIASLTDPAELALNTFLMEGAPLTGLAKAAQLSAEAGELVRPSVAARFFARYPSNTILNNPLVSGAVEGAGSVGLMSPLTYFNSKALGKKYTLEDALTGIAAAGVVGAGMAGVHGLISQGADRVRSAIADHGAPIDPMKAHLSAEMDMNNGNPVDVGRSIDVAKRTKDLADARAEVEQQALNSQPRDLTAEVLADHHAPATDKESLPVEPVDLTNPEAVRHTTPLEQRLLAVTDPEAFKSVMHDHLTEINLNIAKLGELLHLPESDRLAAHDDITLLQNEIISKFANLNEILPTAEKGLPTEFKTTNKGLMTKKSLQVIGKEVARLNDLAVREMDDPTRLASLQAEHTRISAELKKAMSQLKQGQAKGWSTVEDWQKKVGELTPQLEHASRLLQAHGVNVTTPELSLSHYADSLGDYLPPALKDFIDTNPGKMQEPLYRVRNSIFDAIRSRMDQTQKYLQDLDYTQPVRKFPEDDEILRELNHFMDTEGQGTMDPTAIHEEAAKVIDQQIAEYKSLGIFDEKNIERFDNIKKQFDEQLQKTDAVKKGSLQAQICALGGVTEDE